MKLAVVGAGRVGLVSALVLWEAGHEVLVVDTDPSRVAELTAGRAPFFEPGLPELLARANGSPSLTFTTSHAELARCHAAFLCVPTPGGPDGRSDTSALGVAAETLVDALRVAGPSSVLAGVFVRSTCMPGTTRSVVGARLASLGGGASLVGVMPEFLREGSAIADQRAPDRIVVGADSPALHDLARAIFESTHAPIVATTPETAELIKATNNALLSTCISFANEIACIAERVPGVDALAVMESVHLDRRLMVAAAALPRAVGLAAYLTPGAGFGGSCLGKDLRSLAVFARDHGESTPVLDAAARVNDEQPRRFVARIDAALEGARGKRVLVLGLAFKPDTDDVRDSIAFVVVSDLVRLGARVAVHDPVATSSFFATAATAVADPLDAERRALCRVASPTVDWTAEARVSDAVVLVTSWREYLEGVPAAIVLRSQPVVLADGRNVFRALASRVGVVYVGPGLETKPVEESHDRDTDT